jgi:hypothetical protein
MATRVELEVTDSGFSFTLDDATKGKLDDTTYTLSTGFRDITDYVVSVSTSRGRNRDLEKFNAGSASVRLRNEDRTFDPLNMSSPFVNEMVPRRLVRVFTDEIQQFQGLVDSWKLSYAPTGESIAEISVTDEFQKLAGVNINLAVSEQLTGARVTAVLNNVGWPTYAREIDAGESTVASGTAVQGALEHLQLVESSEAGLLFISKDGNLVFRERNSFSSGYVPVVFADDGSGIPFTAAEVSYGTDLLFNQVEVTYSGGTAVASNASSQAKYGVITNSVDTLLASASAAQDFASYYVGEYGEPEYRFSSIEVTLRGVDSTQYGDVLQLEIGDLVQIRFTPNGVGSQINKYALVTSLDNDITVDDHRVRVGVSSLDFLGLVLDDVALGILDSNVLAF